MQRPRPVLILGLVLVALTAVTTFADVQNIIPNVVLTWLRLATVVLGAVGTAYVQSIVTPLSDPRAADGTPLRKLARGGPVRPAGVRTRTDDAARPTRPEPTE